MRQMLIDISQVATMQTRHLDPRIENTQVEALPHQNLCEHDQRALAQIIRVGLETKTHQSNSPSSRLLYQANSPAQLVLVRLENRRHQGKLQ